MRYILPGMGTSSKMYSGPWHGMEDSTFLDWLPYNHEKTISELADRFVKGFKITQNDVVIGSSLGGVIGLEILKKIGLKKVYLIGSLINPNEANRFLRKIIFPFVNIPIVKLSQWTSLLMRDELRQIYAKFSSEFIVNMSKAILVWDGFNGDMSKIARIHGKKDPFINCPNDCEIIEKGGHMIAISHADECVDFINKH